MWSIQRYLQLTHYINHILTNIVVIFAMQCLHLSGQLVLAAYLSVLCRFTANTLCEITYFLCYWRHCGHCMQGSHLSRLVAPAAYLSALVMRSQYDCGLYTILWCSTPHRVATRSRCHCVDKLLMISRRQTVMTIPTSLRCSTYWRLSTGQSKHIAKLFGCRIYKTLLEFWDFPKFFLSHRLSYAWVFL